MSESQIFISHAHDDTTWSRAFANALTERGAAPWYDEWSIKPGEKLRVALERALRASDTVVFILSPRSIQSAALFWELGAAVAMNKRIIPVISEELDRSRIPVPLLQTRYLTRGTPDEIADEVLKAVA